MKTLFLTSSENSSTNVVFSSSTCDILNGTKKKLQLTSASGIKFFISEVQMQQNIYKKINKYSVLVKVAVK